MLKKNYKKIIRRHKNAANQFAMVLKFIKFQYVIKSPEF